MGSLSKSVLVTKAVKIYPLVIPMLLVFFVYQEGWDWKAFFITFVITYLLWAPGIVFAQYYEDFMVVFQPFIFKKRIISYEQIEHIKEVTVGQFFPNASPFDLYVYVKDKKQPIGIPMPSSKLNKRKFKKLIESKGIRANWGIFGYDS